MDSRLLCGTVRKLGQRCPYDAAKEGRKEGGKEGRATKKEEEAPLPVDLKKAGASQGRDTLCSPLLSGCSAARVAHPFSPARASRSLPPSLPA